MPRLSPRFVCHLAAGLAGLSLLLSLAGAAAAAGSNAYTPPVDRANRETLLHACKAATAVAQLEVAAKGNAASRAWVLRCEKERTNPQATPCFVARRPKCVKGTCPPLGATVDLRRLGVDVSDYAYMKKQFVYLMWGTGATPEPDWGISLEALGDKTIADQCK